MIKFIRLDERLIHGQVAIKWSRHTGVDRIVVINDAAANNDIVKKSLMMAAPTTAKVAIKDLESGIALLNDPRCESLKILVIVSVIDDLLSILEQVPNIPYVNVGNYGRIAPKQEGKTRTSYRANLYLYEDEAKKLKELVLRGVKCNYQTTPEETDENLENILK